MKIKDVVCAAGSTGFYFDDQRAIKRGAGHDGMFYIGQPVTEGFSAVRMKGEAVSVMIVLEDGQIAFGDCAAVQYSGAGGRDPLFLAKDFIPIIEQYVRPMLLGREADDFRGLCAQMEAIEVNGKRLHTAIRYGVSQAILDAVAKATGRLMCEVVADEYGCTVSQTPIPIFTQSGDDRYDNADKMIIKRAQVLPHALINNVQTKLGEHGEKLLEYVKWLRDRILTMRADESYQPVLHIDVYGTIGAAFGNNNYAAMADYLAELEQAAKPFHLRIEGPMDCDCDRETQIVALAGLTAELDRRGIQVELVADEWCNTLEDIREFADRRAGHMVQIKTPDLGGINNTIEAVLYCKAHGIGAYQGGTCNETDRSAQVCVHCAMATQPVQILAKPGMGVDEGYMIVSNEMNRILALRLAKLRSLARTNTRRWPRGQRRSLCQKQLILHFLCGIFKVCVGADGSVRPAGCTGFTEIHGEDICTSSIECLKMPSETQLLPACISLRRRPHRFNSFRWAGPRCGRSSARASRHARNRWMRHAPGRAP